MNAKSYHNYLQQLTQPLGSFSLVNQEGQLLFSKDRKIDCLTTSRLVCFQIVKKYLQPQPLDMYVMNDPENGGFGLTKIIFVAALSENLYLIWNDEFNFIDFKIPPTPLYEKGQKNSFVWKALVESHPQEQLLKTFFETKKQQLDSIFLQTEHIKILSLAKNQSLWLKATQEIFELQFENKALGSAESFYRTHSDQIIKLKLSVEERQNIKLLTLDFTNTSLASDYFASSHVVESGMIQKIIQFYQIEDFFSQSILDKIKIMLPPKSIVSKAHHLGLWNDEIQSICAQLCAFNLAQLNSQTRKVNTHFEIAPELKFDIVRPDGCYTLSFDQKKVSIEDFESLLTQSIIQLVVCQRNENNIRLRFHFLDTVPTTIQIKSKLFLENKDYFFKINDSSVPVRKNIVSKNDQIEIIWKIL